MKLTPVVQKFILHWGEMGTRWGINRTVAQIHALLYLSSRPLTAEEITETLSVARSNVSNSLRELQSWGLIKVVHILGDRRDHFESSKDVWDMFRLVVTQRKQREIDPTLALIRECAAEAAKPGAADLVTRDRLDHMQDFFETISAFFDQMNKLPTSVIIRIMRMGEKVRKLLQV
jgi:DNA-binding transcriptional regulator GbsR (MarR family)